MKTRKLAILTLLFLPFTLMANSPNPVRAPDEYTDVEVSNFTLVSESKNKYLYTLDVTNTGEGFVDLYRYTVSGQSIYTYTDDLIGPLGTETLEIEFKNKVNFTDLSFAFLGYQIKYVHDDVIDLQAVSSISRTYDMSEERYTYAFNIQYKKVNDKFNGYYRVVTKIKDTKTNEYHYFMTADKLSENHSFTTNKDLNVDELYLESFHFIESYEYYQTSSVERFFSAIGNVLLIFAVICLPYIGLLLLLSGIIFVIVFFTVRYLKKGKKKTNKDKDKSTSSEDKKDDTKDLPDK